MGKEVLTALIEAGAKQGWVRARDRVSGNPSLRQLLEDAGLQIAKQLDEMEDRGEKGDLSLNVSLQVAK